MKVYRRKFIVLLITGALLLSLTPSAFAVSLDSRQAVVDTATRQAIIQTLSFIEPEKDYHGLQDIDFTELYIGSRVLAYEYVQEDVRLLDFHLYPLIFKDDIVAFAWKQDDSEFVGIRPSFAKEINECIDKNEDFALLFDNNNSYLVSRGELKLLYESPQEIDYRDSIIDTTFILPSSLLSRESGSVPVGFSEENRIPITRSSPALYVSYIPQVYSDICWAACTAMIGYYLTGVSLTAQQVAVSYFGSDFNKPAYTSTVVNRLWFLYNIYYLEYTTVPTLSTIINCLQAGRPVYSTWSVTSTLSHATVVRGASSTANTISILDPLMGAIAITVSTNSSGQFSYVSNSGSTLVLISTYAI